MTNSPSLVSNAFKTFMKEAPQQAQAWGSMVQAWLAPAPWIKKRLPWHTCLFWQPYAWKAAFLFTCNPPGRLAPRVKRSSALSWWDYLLQVML